MDESEKKLVGVLQSAEAIVGYTPISDEPSYREFLSDIGVTAGESLVPPDASASPDQLAEHFEKTHSGKRTVVFLPGRKFDQFGTRHGRGFGWYDRLLAAVPPEWVRIGVLTDDLMHEKLERKNWDQPVDYLLIKRDGGYQVLETGARFPRS